MTIRPIRLAAGWTLALVAALLLNLVLDADHHGARRRGAVCAAAARHRAAVRSHRRAVALGDDPIDRLPPVVALPPEGIPVRAPRGPQELIPLKARQAPALQAATHRARVAFGLDALAIGVSVDGTSGWTGASGWARDGLTRLDGNSPFAIASITKTFTAALTLQLVDEGRLRLSDRVTDLLPGVQVPSSVRVAHLLRHTSGIADLLEPMRDELNADHPSGCGCRTR